jgi:hypothetical protein
MKLRLAGTLVLVLAIAALASASAYAGNGNGNGNGKNGPAADAPGQLKKDDVPAVAPATSESIAQDAGNAQTGVKPSNDTALDTYAAASSDQTKQYGNGKTAGQIAIGNGAAPSTVLHGPGNSQPHKASPCSGGHEVDVHALKGKRGRACGTQPPAPRPNPTPEPAKPGDPARGPNTSDGTPAAASSPADPSTPAKPKPVVNPHRGDVESASGVLSATGAIGGGTLPFTGFPIWIIVLIALALITVGMTLRRRISAPSA